MAKTLHLTIAGVGETLFDGAVMSVTLPGTEGVFTVMAGHEPFVTPLAAGTALVKTAEGTETAFSISAGGICEVSGDQASVLL